MSAASVSVLARGSVEIRRGCLDVFAYVADLEHFPAWFPGVAAMRAVDALDPAQVGKRYRETLRLPFGRTGIVDIEVKEARAPARFMTEGLGFLMPSMSIDLVALADGRTRVDWRMVSRDQRRWLRWLVIPLVRRVMGRRAAVGLRRLRDNLERGAA